MLLHVANITNYANKILITFITIYFNKVYKVLIIFRQINSGTSDAIEPTKMQAKNIVLNQWKIISELKSYFSKLATDKTVEIALNKEFTQFLQKIDAKSYGNDLVRYFTSMSVSISKKLEMTEINQEQGKISLPNILNELVNGKPEEKKEVIPKWKISRTLVSKVCRQYNKNNCRYE